jgi:hypothetical protein
MTDWSSCLVNGVPTLGCLEVLFSMVLNSLAGLIFIILLAMFVFGSISWLTAGDSPEKLKKAKGVFFSALLGLGIIAISYLVLIILESFLGIDGLTIFKINTN